MARASARGDVRNNSTLPASSRCVVSSGVFTKLHKTASSGAYVIGTWAKTTQSPIQKNTGGSAGSDGHGKSMTASFAGRLSRRLWACTCDQSKAVRTQDITKPITVSPPSQGVGVLGRERNMKWVCREVEANAEGSSSAAPCMNSFATSTSA